MPTGIGYDKLVDRSGIAVIHPRHPPPAGVVKNGTPQASTTMVVDDL
ncbi:MAG: hypothetical protein WBD31_04960 [Rubripirellula sp.]